MRILFIFLIAALPSFAFAEGMHSVVFNSELLFKVQDDPAFKYREGIKVTAPDFCACAAFSINALSFSDARSLKPEEFLELQKKTYGVKAHFNCGLLSSDMEVLAGTLSLSGSLSRLKNPKPSSGQSALSSMVFPSSGFNPSLPSFSSGEKPLSFSFVMKNASSFMPDLKFYASENGEFVFSSVSSLSFLGTSLSLTLGIFKHGFSKESASWKLDRPFYKEDSFLSLESRFSMSLEKFRSCLICGFHEQPSGKVSGWGRFYASVYAGPLVLDAVSFYCPSPAVCADGSLCERTFWFMLNPKFSVPSPYGTFSLGLVFQEDFVSPEKLTEDESSALSLKGAVRFHRNKLLLSLYASYKDAFPENEVTESAGISLSRAFRKVKPSLSVSIREEKNKKTVSASASALFRNSPLNEVSLNVQNEDQKTRLSAAAAFSGGSRSLRWNLRLSLEVK